jgi:hypothetical protein
LGCGGHDGWPGGFVGDVVVQVCCAEFLGQGGAGGIVEVGEDEAGTFTGEGAGGGGADT